MDLRVLVVCPDQDSASQLDPILAEMGMTAEQAPSISRGLELLETRRFDAIVLDYRADESSEEFVARLRLSPKNRATMLIAIVEGEYNARLAFVLGANFVLYRPLSSERTRISLRAARGLMRTERRRSPRMPLNSSANVAYPGAPELKALMANLSDGGTSIHSPNRIPPLCKVYFEFALPSQKQLVRLSGEVAWQDSSGRTGIRFLDVPQASRRLMQTWLQQNSVPATVPEQPSAGESLVPQSSPTLPSTTTTSTQTFAAESRPLRQKRTGPDPTLVSNAGNRRGELRMDCRLGAEVYSVGTSVPNRCTLSDISEGGCYVEMPSPLAGNAGVEILIRTADTKLRIKGEVLTAHPGFGMGVRFTFRDSAEREKILRLLALLANGSTLDEQPR